jgi:hypothetical protein
MFFTSKFSYLLFRNPTHKTEIGQQIRGKLLIAIHLDQSLRWANQNHWLVVRSYLLHSFRQVPTVAAAFHKPPQTVQWCSAKTILVSKTMTFLHPILLCRSHTEHRWRCSKEIQILQSKIQSKVKDSWLSDLGTSGQPDTYQVRHNVQTNSRNPNGQYMAGQTSVGRFLSFMNNLGIN